MITFETGLDGRTRQSKPAVAKFNRGDGAYAYCIIGTAYGHIHTAGGCVRLWGSYSGARKFLTNYLKQGTM